MLDDGQTEISQCVAITCPALAGPEGSSSTCAQDGMQNLTSRCFDTVFGLTCSKVWKSIVVFLYIMGELQILLTCMGDCHLNSVGSNAFVGVYGSTCTIKCGDNYEASSADYKCGDSGAYELQSSAAVSTCTLKKCAPLSEIAGATGCTEAITVGSSCTVSCGADYVTKEQQYTW